MSSLKYTITVLFLKLITVLSFTMDIFDSSSRGEKPRLIGMVGDSKDFKKGDVRSKLPTGDLRTTELRRNHLFEDFANAMIDLLAGFPGRMLTKYLRTVYREVDKLEYKYTKSLGKKIREISRMDRDEVRDEMIRYRDVMQKKGPKLEEFIKDMNDLLTMEEGVKFSDYIFNVRDYGNLDKRDVVEETREVLNYIIRAVKRLSSREQIKLEQKLRRAVREYDRETEDNFYSLLFHGSPSTTSSTLIPSWHL